MKPDYDKKERLNLLNMYLEPNDKILEIGANDGSFVNTLNSNGYIASGFDPLDNENKSDVQKKFISESVLDKENKILYDAVISYYVLEHITEPKKWLKEIIRPLKKNGLVVMEVPDFRLYPRESLHYEHFQHFTGHHLKALFSNCGIQTLEVSSSNVSRYFGIIIIGKYIGTKLPHQYEKKQFELNLEVYNENKNNKLRIEALCIELCTQVIKKVEHLKISNKRTCIYFWGANDLSSQLGQILKNQFNKNGQRIIDSSSEKNNQMLTGFDFPVEYPVKESLSKACPIFIICSYNYYSQINTMIEDMGIDKYHIFDGTKPFCINQ